MEPYVQWQKAEKVVIHSVVSSRLKNEAGRLISLGSQMKYIFLGLGCEILTKAFLIAHLQLKVTQQLFILIFKNQGLHEEGE